MAVREVEGPAKCRRAVRAVPRASGPTLQQKELFINKINDDNMMTEVTEELKTIKTTQTGYQVLTWAKRVEVQKQYLTIKESWVLYSKESKQELSQHTPQNASSEM